MSQQPQTPIRIRVDTANPGQFFACCGLLELANRISKADVEGWFDSDKQCFSIYFADSQQAITLPQLAKHLASTSISSELTPETTIELRDLEERSRQLRKVRGKLPEDAETRRKYLGSLLRAGPVFLSKPFGLRLDWWQAESNDVPKTWAGSQSVIRIARSALAGTPLALNSESPFDYFCVMSEVNAGEGIESEIVTDDSNDDASSSNKDFKKVEPFYFDVRRGSKPFSRDIGFSPDQLGMTTVAYPAVEFLCLVGLQRFRPKPTEIPRVFEYFTWSVPLHASIAPAGVCGLLPHIETRRYRFENAFRTDQRKHKAFAAAIQLSV